MKLVGWAKSPASWVLFFPAIVSCGSPQFVPVDGFVVPASAMVVDLTHSLESDVETLPGQYGVSVDGEALETRITIGSDIGTTFIAPSCSIPGQLSCERVSSAHLIGPAVVIDISSRVEENPNSLLTVQDISNWKALHGEIPAGAVVVVRSGWSLRWGRQDERARPARSLFYNPDENGQARFPGVDPNAARMLVTSADIQGIAIDTPSLGGGQVGPSGEALEILHRAGRWAVTQLSGLERLPASGAMIWVAPLKLGGVHRAPTRVVGLVPR